MENQKIFFPTNIKFLRERKKLSQETVAEKLGITRSKLMALESGQTKAPQPEDLINFSENFKISIDSLLKVNLAKLGELKLRELEAGNDVYMAGGNIRVLAITVDKRNRENVEYVPIKAKAGYIAGYSDPEFIATLPKYSFPDLPKNGTYRMFSTTGDSMLPIPENSDIIANYILDWKSIRTGTLCVIILKNQDIVFKKISITENDILLQSLNSIYQDYLVPLSEVLEVWEYKRFISEKIPVLNDEMIEIKFMIQNLQNDIKNLR